MSSIIFRLFPDLALPALPSHRNQSPAVGTGVLYLCPLTQAHRMEYVLLRARQHINLTPLVDVHPAD